MSSDMFDPDADQKRYEFWTRRQAPSKVYSILFTPRSGSSWLTSILTNTKAMGTPGEWFNPELMPASSRAKGARNIDQFVEAISRHEIHGDIFGFEITHHQLIAVFGNDENFMSRFRDAIFFWLIREDIVAQGVSLDKMVRTNVGHSANSDPHALERSDVSYDYDAGRIRKWIQHIHDAEIRTEKLIADFGLSPTRLSYEAITSAGAQNVASLFAEKLGLEDFISSEELPSEHRKIGTSKNDEFSERFRAENQGFVSQIDRQRAEMLSHCK